MRVVLGLNGSSWISVNSLTERARWWWGTAPSEISGESTKQYSRQTPVFLGGRCSRTSGWTPEARSRICVCRASFLMTFVQSGMPPRLPAHDQAIDALGGIGFGVWLTRNWDAPKNLPSMGFLPQPGGGTVVVGGTW